MNRPEFVGEPTLKIDLVLHMWKTDSPVLQILEREALDAFRLISKLEQTLVG